jgi:hypothetical protein
MRGETLEFRLNLARHVVWRNNPGCVSTFSNCPRCTRGERARGNGVCLLCARDDLAELIGSEEAERYVKAVEELRRLESSHLELAQALFAGKPM